MSIRTIRILIAGALFVHGIGHALGLWKPARNLSFAKLTESQLRLAEGIIWVVIAVGFIVSAMSLFEIIVPAGL